MLEIAIYLIYSGIFVLSAFFAIKIMVASNILREHWRDQLKRRFYLSRRQFNLYLNVIAVLLLIIAGFTAYYSLRDIIESF